MSLKFSTWCLLFAPVVFGFFWSWVLLTLWIRHLITLENSRERHENTLQASPGPRRINF